jgi:hypothetical protein
LKRGGSVCADRIEKWIVLHHFFEMAVAVTAPPNFSQHAILKNFTRRGEF